MSLLLLAMLSASFWAGSADAVSPKKSARYIGKTSVGPWDYSIGDYTAGSRVDGPNLTFQVSDNGKRIVGLHTDPPILGQPGYCGGDRLQGHQPILPIDQGHFEGKRVQTFPDPRGAYTVTTTVKGHFVGSGKIAVGSFSMLHHFPDPTSRCDEHGTFAVHLLPAPRASVGIITSSPYEADGSGRCGGATGSVLYDHDHRYCAPQCTGTVIRAVNRSLVVTAAHCVVAPDGEPYRDFRFSPAHTGAHPRFSEDYDNNPTGVGRSPYGVWYASRIFVNTQDFLNRCPQSRPHQCFYDNGENDPTHDYAFLVMSRNYDHERPQDLLGPVPTAHFLSLPNVNASTLRRLIRHLSQGQWSAYGYDITTPDLTPRTELGLHSCTRDTLSAYPAFLRGPAFPSLLRIGRESDKPCGLGIYASGGPWIKKEGKKFLLSVVQNGITGDGHSIGSPLGPGAEHLYEAAEKQRP